MSVLFHGSFPLNRKYMSGILKPALNNPGISDKQLAEPFGYSAPFTARYRSWLHKTGVTELGAPLRLTEKGKVVFENDPKFESIITQWFLHHELVTDPERAESWHFFALEFLPKHQQFTKEDLLAGLAEKLGPHSMKHFGPGSSLNKTILRKIVEVYTKDECLGQLGLLKAEKAHYVRQKPKTVLGPWKNPEDLNRAYE